MKKRIVLLLSALLICLFTGCQSTVEPSQKNKQVEEDSQYYIYYLNNNESQLVREPYEPNGVTMEEQLAEYIEALKHSIPKNLTYKKALPDYVEIAPEEKIENGQLTLNLDTDYLNLTGALEVLCRAAIVKTVCQVEGIEYVEFVIDGQPLKNSNDAPIGFMKAEDFIDNTGGETKYMQNATVTLYFSDPSGKYLVSKRVSIKQFNGTIPLEELVVSQLIKGPQSIQGIKEGEILPVMPEKTVLNKVIAKDGVCYVDFDETFLKGVEGVSNVTTIYSIANSLIEIYSINKVQFSVNGEPIKKFGEGLDLSVPIERNLDIVMEKD